MLKLPLSVSLVDGSPAFLLLYAALNGLRDASQAWLHLLADLIKPLGCSVMIVNHACSRAGLKLMVIVLEVGLLCSATWMTS